MDIVDAQVHLNRLGSNWEHTSHAVVVDYAVATIYQADLAKIGVTLNIRAYDPATWATNVLGSVNGLTINQYGAWYFTDAWLNS